MSRGEDLSAARMGRFAGWWTEKARMTVSEVPSRHTLPHGNEIVDAGDNGVAVAGNGGYARAGRHGHATAQGAGIAIAGAYGTAVAQDGASMAVVGPFGTATAGEDGIAVAHGSGASASAGDWGVAVTTGQASHIGLGHGGIGVALRSIETLKTHTQAIAVVLGAVDRATEIEAGEGSVIILRHQTADLADVSFDFHVSGPVSRRPGVRYLWQDRILQPVGANSALPNTPIETEPAAGWQLDERLAHISRAHDTIVLCPEGVVGSNETERLESGDLLLRASQWNADPASPSGILGLSWGEGDADAVGLDRETIWLLLHVPAPIAVSTIHGRAVRGVVKFATGTILFFGTREAVIGQLSALGGNCDLLASEVFRANGNGLIAIAPRGGAALAGHAGWAIAPGGQDANADADGIAVSSGGMASAGRGGLAVAFNGGIARAGDNGIAVSDGKRFGEAHGGDLGIAVGRGRFKRITAGMAGAAVSRGGDARVADEGVAIGIGNDNVHAGTNGIAVTVGGTVSGNDGCLLVAIAPDRSWIVTARVGVNGIEPFVRYRLEP
jgi:hypothetical protein